MSEEISNQVLYEKIQNLVVVNVAEHKGLKEQLVEIKNTVDVNHEKFENRIRSLEDWRLKFVAKFSVYSAIALAIGSLLGQLLVKYLDKLIQ